MSVDVWVRATNQARTEALTGVPENAAAWTDADVRHLLTEMLLRARARPEPPAATRRPSTCAGSAGS